MKNGETLLILKISMSGMQIGVVFGLTFPAPTLKIIFFFGQVQQIMQLVSQS
jgi:hypothetical protein